MAPATCGTCRTKLHYRIALDDYVCINKDCNVFGLAIAERELVALPPGQSIQQYLKEQALSHTLPSEPTQLSLLPRFVCHIDYDISIDSYLVWIARFPLEGGRSWTARPLEFAEPFHEVGQRPPPTFIPDDNGSTRDLLQAIVDAAWAHGIKPSRGALTPPQGGPIK